MHHRQLNLAQVPGFRTLPDKYPSKPLPLMTCSLKVVYHRCPIVVLRQGKYPKVIEGGEQGEGGPIDSDRQLCPRPLLLLQQATPLYFLYPAATVCSKVPAIEGLVQHKHVTIGAPGLRSITLLQDHNCVLLVAVRKVDP